MNVVSRGREFSIQKCIAAGLGAVVISATAFGADANGPSSGDDALRAQVEALTARVNSQDLEIARLKAREGEEWLTVERAKEIRGIVEDVLADAEARTSFESAGATAGYDRGFFIASPDGNFKLVFTGQLVLRYSVSRLSTRSLHQLDPGTYQPPVTGAQNGFPGGTEIKGYQGWFGGGQNTERTARGFDLREIKLEFSGHVVDPSWQYRVVVSFSQTSNQTPFGTIAASSSQAGVSSTGPLAGNASAGPSTGGASAGLEDVFVRKVFDPNWSLRVGQFKSPLLKEELVSSKRLLAADRSLVNQLFTTKRTQGVELQFQNDCLRVLASFNDGGNNSNTRSIIGNSGSAGSFTEYALTGRTEWKIAGEWRQFEDMSSFVDEGFAMYVGGAVNWQRGGGDDSAVFSNSWTTGGGANGTFQNQAGTVFVNGVAGTGALVPIAALQYPNNIPTNANDDVKNLTFTVDSMIDFGGVSLFGALVGNMAYDIPAGWVANPSGGFGSTPASPPGPANNVPGNWSAVTSGALLANGQPAPPSAIFIPGYGYGNAPIYSYGVVLQAGWFFVDDIELFGRYEWYTTLNNGANGYAGNTASFWGAVPGGSSPFANNTINDGVNPGFPGPNAGVNSPTDGYIGGQTNPYYAYNLGANPYGAQMNNIVTVGANWYPAGYRNRMLKLTGDLAYSFGPVLYQNGIFGQSVGGPGYRNDGGQPGGGQWVGRLQFQLLF